MSILSARVVGVKINSVQIQRVSRTSPTPYLPWLVVCHRMPFFQRYKLQVLQLQSFRILIRHVHDFAFRASNPCAPYLVTDQSEALW